MTGKHSRHTLLHSRNISRSISLGLSSNYAATDRHNSHDSHFPIRPYVYRGERQQEKEEAQQSPSSKMVVSIQSSLNTNTSTQLRNRAL